MTTTNDQLGTPGVRFPEYARAGGAERHILDEIANADDLAELGAELGAVGNPGDAGWDAPYAHHSDTPTADSRGDGDTEWVCFDPPWVY